MAPLAVRPPAIVYDASRLFIGASARTPRGIDRVDFDYASNLLETWPGDAFALLPTPWGVRLFDRERSAAALAFLNAHWRERGDADHDPALTRVLQRLAGDDPGPSAPRRARGGLRAIGRLLGMMHATGPSVGRSAVRGAPRGAIYLNVGQIGFAAAMTTPWLRRRPDMQAIFLVHDVIPIEHPEFVTAAGLRSARLMLNVVREHATGLILSTEAAHGSVLRELARMPPPVTLTVPLPIAQVFLTNEAADPDLAAQRYFIYCGAIDPRKNHLMLLEVWQRLHARLGPATPRLVIAGSAAAAGGEILRALQNCGDLRPYVIVASGLTSPALRRLLAHARALVFPSLAEGFGLPVIEALTLDTPVILSDLPALREAAGGRGIYLRPDDVEGWATTIEKLALDDQALAGLREDIDGFRPMTAPAYFETVRDFLLSLGPRKTP